MCIRDSHEVIFGFPYQTVRLIHNSIDRRAFGTGTAFALSQLATCDNGFYSYDAVSYNHLDVYKRQGYTLGTKFHLLKYNHPAVLF